MVKWVETREVEADGRQILRSARWIASGFLRIFERAVA